MPLMARHKRQPLIQSGSYRATLKNIAIATGTVKDDGNSEYLRWTFVVAHPELGGVELVANSSLRFGPKSKARRWAQALAGRDVPDEFDLETLKGAGCLLSVSIGILGDGQQVNQVEGVVPLPRAQTQLPLAVPEPAQAQVALPSGAAAGEEDDVPF